jgi:hypothetical protein
MQPTFDNEKVGFLFCDAASNSLGGEVGGVVFQERPGVDDGALGRFLFSTGAAMALSYGHAAVP